MRSSGRCGSVGNGNRSGFRVPGIATERSYDPGVASAIDERSRLDGLRRWNFGVGLAHLAQAVAVVALGNGFAIPLVAAVQTGPPGTPLVEEATFFDLSFAWAIGVFLLLAAVDHLAVATFARGRYEADLRRGINVFRWAEYSVSASVMVVLIAMLTGVTDLYAVIGLFAANAAMIGFGYLMERVNRDRTTVTWIPFTLGCVVGAVPWVVITIAIVVSSANADGVPRSE